MVWRNPKTDEVYIDTTQELTESTRDFVSCHYMVIEPDWTAPDWMPKGWWLAMEKTGEWFLYENEPEYNEKVGWAQKEHGMWDGIPEWLDWTPPIVDGAEDSLRQI